MVEVGWSLRWGIERRVFGHCDLREWGRVEQCTDHDRGPDQRQRTKSKSSLREGERSGEGLGGERNGYDENLEQILSEDGPGSGT